VEREHGAHDGREQATAVTTRRVTSPDGTALPVRIARGAKDTATLVLAHGAGTGMGHPSLVRVQDGLAARGTTVVTFDFPYRARGSGAPDRMPVLVAAFEAVIAAVRGDVPDRLFLGGRSMGGRVASHVVAAGMPVNGLVFLAFPLHPPGKPGTSRAEHLATIRAPMLFVQGTRDTFARPDLLATVLAGLPSATLHAIPDADHGFHVPKRTGRNDVEVLDEVIATVAGWIARA
jgi:predicted alpha/beta-hydrolase family hydrolase